MNKILLTLLLLFTISFGTVKTNDDVLYITVDKNKDVVFKLAVAKYPNNDIVIGLVSELEMADYEGKGKYLILKNSIDEDDYVVVKLQLESYKDHIYFYRFINVDEALGFLERVEYFTILAACNVFDEGEFETKNISLKGFTKQFDKLPIFKDD